MKDFLPNNSSLLTIQQAASILGVSTKTLRRWDTAGVLTPQRTAGNQRRYTKEQIDIFKKKRETPFGVPQALNSSQVPPSRSPFGHLEGASDLLNRHSGEERSDDSRISLLHGDKRFWASQNDESVVVDSFTRRGLAKLGRPSFFKITILAFCMCFLTGLSILFLLQKVGKGDVVLGVREYFLGPRDVILNSFQDPETSSGQRLTPDETRSRNPFDKLRILSLPKDKFGMTKEQGQVLQAATTDNNLFFNVNIPSKFAEDSEFLRGISAAEIATLSGGIVTNNADIDAGTGTLTGSNVLYDVIADTGIAISEGQTPTITNTDLGSSQNIFKTIKVGSDSFSSGSNTDTLEFASGTGISLSTDTTNKKITITGSATSGWTDDGTTVRLTTSTDSVGIGTTSPSTKLHVAGNVTFTGTTALNGVTYTWPSADGSSDYILTTNGSGTLSWIAAGGNVNFWQRNSGGLSPFNITDDLLLGATSTTSAKFGLINVAGGTPTATISANSGNNAAYLTGAGNLATTNMQTLTLGGSTTGNIVIDSGSSSVTLSDFTSNGGPLYTNGSGVLAQVTAGTSTQCLLGGTTPSFSNNCGGGSIDTFWNQTSGALYPNNSTVDLLIGAQATTSAKFAVLNMTTGTPTASISANSGNNATTLTGTGVLGTTNAQTLTLGDSTTGNILVSANSGSNNAFRITDGTNAYFTLDTRTTTSGTSALTLAAGTAPTIASAASAEYTTLTLTPPTITLTGTTQVTTQMDSILFNAPTITDSSAVTVDRAATFSISGAPSVGGSLTIANDFAFSVVAGNIGYGANSMLAYGGINDKLIDDMEAITDWTASDTTNTPVSLESTTVKAEAGAMQIDTTAGSSINDTVIKNMGFTSDLSSVDRIGFWIRPTSTVSGELISVGFSEDNTTYQTNNVTIDANNSDKWVYHEWNISSITSTSRDAVQYYRFRSEEDNGSPTFYIDQLRYYDKDNRASEVYVDGGGRLQIAGEQGFDIIANIASTRPTISANGTNVEINQPLNVNVGGDVGIDYDLTFLNTGTANITSEGPLSILAGDANHAENLTLGTQGTGDVVIDINDAAATTGGFKILGDSGYVHITTRDGQTGIGTISPLATLDVRPNLLDGGTVAIASASGATSFAALLTDNTGVGALFTASKSGATKFTILNTGNIQWAGTTTVLSTLASAATAARTWTFPDETGTICMQSSANCGFAIGSTTNWWNSSSGALYPVNSTLDFLAGGQATTSAKFAVLNLNSGTPTASISANSGNNAVFLTGLGVLGTTNAQTLQIGDSTTGNVNIAIADKTATEALCHATDDNVGTVFEEIIDCSGSPVADYAEMYPVGEGIDYGDIVVTGTEVVEVLADDGRGKVLENKPKRKIVRLVKSDKSYQSNVIGIVSNNYNDFSSIGHSVIDPKDNPMPVALNGRVPVKVNTENGAIEAGDFLTTSSTPGVAMKATRAGQVIGKALEGFNSDGIGKIMVFINLTWHDPNVYIAADGNLSGSQLSVLGSQFSDNSQSVVGKSETDKQITDQPESENGQQKTDNSYFDIGTDPLFKDLTDRVALLENRINNLAESTISASTSALLSEIQESSVGEITEIGDIREIENATISGTLAVLGRTTVSDFGITGSINTGLLSINGLDTLASGGVGSTVNTLSGNLYLQNLGLGGIDILGGKIVIDTKGNINVSGTITADKINISEEDKETASIGSGVIKALGTSVTISSTSATDNSKIFVTSTTLTGGQSLFVSKKTPGVGFVVAVEKPHTRDIKFDWWIVN